MKKDEPIETLEYHAFMTKGKPIPISERDVAHIRRCAKQGFVNPMHRLFGDKPQDKEPKIIINFKKLILIREINDKYKESMELWKENQTRHIAVVETGADLMLSEKDYNLIEKRSKRYNTTPIIEFIESIDGTLMLNLEHLVCAYKKDFEKIMSKELFAENLKTKAVKK